MRADPSRSPPRGRPAHRSRSWSCRSMCRRSCGETPRLSSRSGRWSGRRPRALTRRLPRSPPGPELSPRTRLWPPRRAGPKVESDSSCNASLRNVGSQMRLTGVCLDAVTARYRSVTCGGRLNQKRVKRAFESAPTRPPEASTSCLTMARPIPAPPRPASRDFSTR